MAALVQQATNSGGAATLVVTLGATPTDGNCLVCLVVARYNGAAISSITGGGVTWVRGANSSTNEDAEIWYGLNVSSGGAAITITPAITADCAAVVAEFSGVFTAAANDGAGASNNGTASPADTGTYATGNANDLLLAVTGDRNIAAVGTSNIGGWIDFAQPAGTGNLSMRASYQFVSATGSYQDTWNITNVFAWDAEIYALKLVPSGGGWSLYRPYTLGAAIDVLTGGLYYYWRRRKQEKPDE